MKNQKICFLIFISIQRIKIAIRELQEVIPEMEKKLKFALFWKIDLFDPGTLKNVVKTKTNPKKTEKTDGNIGIDVYTYISNICMYVLEKIQKWAAH